MSFWISRLSYTEQRAGQLCDLQMKAFIINTNIWQWQVVILLNNGHDMSSFRILN